MNRPSFDNAQSHVTAFRPISEAARSWSDDNVSCTLLPVKRWNRSIVISMSSICLQEYRRNCMSDLHQSFCACYQYLWSRLSPLAALQCLTDDVIFAHFTRGASGKACNALLPCFCTAHYMQMQSMLLYFYAPSVLTGSRF